MTAHAGASRNKGLHWNQINWKTVKANVSRLQMRIAKAVKQERWGKVKVLQRMLTHSRDAKLLAIRTVTQNKGARTAGIDGKIWKTRRQKVKALENLTIRGYRAKALRRIHIKKKNGKTRALGIPTIRDRSMQALFALALAPVAETLKDANAYGFYKGRCCQDAIAQCFNALARGPSAQWVWEADIKGCYDNISHDWLMRNIAMDKRVLKQWLKSGYLEKGRWFSTEKGTPQGGIISPILANLTLTGLEQRVRRSVSRQGDCVNVIRYADDFIITAKSSEIIEQKIKPVVTDFLEQRGLTLSEEKTKITSIFEGFDFLGQNVRKYRTKLKITPSKQAFKAIKEKIRAIIYRNRGSSAVSLIHQLNPVIRGWVNYHKYSVCRETFYKLDRFISTALFQWARRRHPKKQKYWITKQYLRCPGRRTQTFYSKSKNKTGQTVIHYLFKATVSVNLKYRKVIAKANPYDSQYRTYFEQRKLAKNRVFSPMSLTSNYAQGILDFNAQY